MKRLCFGLLATVALMAVVACASFQTQAFRAEQAAVNLAYTGYVGWTNFLATPQGQKITSQQSNSVKQVRLKLADSLILVEHMRTTYATNSAVKADYQAALSTLESNAGELVTLITTLKGN